MNRGYMGYFLFFIYFTFQSIMRPLKHLNKNLFTFFYFNLRPGDDPPFTFTDMSVKSTVFVRLPKEDNFGNSYLTMAMLD